MLSSIDDPLRTGIQLLYQSIGRFQFLLYVRAQMANASSCTIVHISKPTTHGKDMLKVLRKRCFTEHSSSHGMNLPLYASQFINHRFKSGFCVFSPFYQSGFFSLPIRPLFVEALFQFFHSA